MAEPDPCTPVSNKVVSRVGAGAGDGGATPGSVHIPATPFLKKLGFGTGVSVFLYSRSPSAGDKYR